jgi:hypothetical protein
VSLRIAGWRIDYGPAFHGVPLAMWIDARLKDREHANKTAIKYRGTVTELYEEVPHENETEADRRRA